MSLAPGTRLGSYEVVTALGAGGMGEVYRARDTKPKGRLVTCKVPLDRATYRTPQTGAGIKPIVETELAAFAAGSGGR